MFPLDLLKLATVVALPFLVLWSANDQTHQKETVQASTSPVQKPPQVQIRPTSICEVLHDDWWSHSH